MKTAIDCQTRVMIHRDFPQVLRIEQESFGDPWREADLKTLSSMRNVLMHVAERKGRVLGYCAYAVSKRNLELISLVVAPEHRLQGIGARLLEQMRHRCLVMSNCNKIVAIVRETNVGGLKFLRASGFLATKLLRENFEDTGEDGIKMVLRTEVTL